MNANDYANQVTDLFVLPDSCVRIKKLIDDNKSSVDELGDVISVDPVLTAIILRLANSAFYNFPTEVTAIAKAIQIIGSRGVYNLVIGYGTKYAFKDMDGANIDLEEFWETSIKVALIAKQLAKKIKHKDPESLFVCGLLLNIGELVVAQVSPNKAKSCNDDNDLLPWKIQKVILGFNYSDCSVELLKVWQLPYTLLKPITEIHNTDSTDTETLLLRLALYQAAKEMKDGIFADQIQIDEEMLNKLELTAKDLQAATDYAAVEGLSILAMLNPGATAIY
jgi:HD-like signal output (HDOD) protein